MRTLEEYRGMVNAAIESALPSEAPLSADLIPAVRYSLIGSGKRLRPSLTLAAAEYAGLDVAQAMDAALAIECVHTYSLIHDDLPCMDDDDYRHGKLSNHKAFSEPTALLAGDALLTLAFALIVRTPSAYPERQLKAVALLAQAAGIEGMVAGQAADMVGLPGQGDLQARIDYIQLNKTAQMFRVAILIGLALGGANESVFSAFSAYGTHLGIAFQMADDLLDIQATSEQMGKSVGKDVEQGKLTYPALLGVQAAQQLLAQRTALAVTSLEDIGDAQWFIDFALALKGRKA